MKIHHYKSPSGRNVISEYIESLAIDEQIDGVEVLRHMEHDEFDQIKWKRWKDKIFEVYFYKHNRLFYVIVDGQDLYVLHACKKQKNETEKRDPNIVLTRAKELGRSLGQTFTK